MRHRGCGVATAGLAARAAHRDRRLRRAGAAFLHRSGVPLEDIRQAGDWVSLTALIYLAKPLSSRINLDMMVVDAILDKK